MSAKKAAAAAAAPSPAKASPAKAAAPVKPMPAKTIVSSKVAPVKPATVEQEDVVNIPADDQMGSQGQSPRPSILDVPAVATIAPAASPKIPANAHKITTVTYETLDWGSAAPRDLLPPPDSMVRCRLVNSVPEVHNMLRRAAMNSLRVYALAHVKVDTDDIYNIRDQVRARVLLIRLRQAAAKWGARTVLKLKVTNTTSDILVVTTNDFTRTDGIRESGFVGVARITTLAPGRTIEITCEVQLATASVGAGHRATGSFRAYGLDYQNVGTIDADSKPGSRWVLSSELRSLVKVAIAPSETPVLVAKGAEYRRVAGSTTRYFEVPVLPRGHSSTEAADANFGLEFRLEACWDPKAFLPAITARLVEVLQGMRDTLAAGGVARAVESDSTQYTFEDVDKCYGGLLRVMIAEADAGIFTNYTCINQHTDGFRIRIAHEKSDDILMAAIMRAIAVYAGAI